MSESLPQGGASNSTNGQNVPVSSGGGQGGGLDDLRIHIQENFGESLAPILERVLFQRGWQNCTLDEFYQNLNNNSTTIVAECRRNINENELVISIEENLLRALFMGHGQNAVQMVQALRYYPLEERFLAMVSPVALAKLLSGLNQGRQQGSPVSSNAPQRSGSFASLPHTPVSANQQHNTAYSSNSAQFNGQQVPKDANYPQQPQGSPNHRVQPPTSGNYHNNNNSSHVSASGSTQQVPPPPAQAPQAAQPTTHTASAGNSWGIGGHGNGPTQQLSPYPNNRQQPSHQGNQNSNNHHMQQNQQQNQQQMPQSYGSSNGGQFPQTNSFESEGSHGGRRGQQHQHQHPAPPAPAPVFYEGDRQAPPEAIGTTPTSQGAQHTNQMSWADEAEQEEYNKQMQERNEAELKEFLDANNSAHLFNAIKKYSLNQLRSLSPKAFEVELKRLICSSSARKALMELLHPDGVYPEDRPEKSDVPEEPEHYALQQDPAQRQHQQAMAARQEAANRKTQATYGKDVASTNAILDTLKLGSPEKVGRGGKRVGAHEDPNCTRKGAAAKSGHSNGVNGSQVSSPNTSSNMNSRLFFDDDPAYQAQQQQGMTRPSVGPGGAKRESANLQARNQRGGKILQNDSDYPTPTSSLAAAGKSRGASHSILVLKGVKGIPLESVSFSLSRMSHVVDFKHGHDEDEAEFTLASYTTELYHARFVTVRFQNQSSKVRVVNFKKGSGAQDGHHPGNHNPAGVRGSTHPSALAAITPGVCKYFGTNNGCHRGESCKFIHSADTPPVHGKFNKPRVADRSSHQDHGRGPAVQNHEDAPANPRGAKKTVGSPLKPRALQDVAAGSGSGSQIDLASSDAPQPSPQQQQPPHSPPVDQGSHTAGGSRPGSNLPSPQKKVSTPIDEIPKPRSFQEAMQRNSSSRSSPIPTHNGSPNGQMHHQYPGGAAPQYSQAPPPPPPHQPTPGYYGGSHDGPGSHPQTPVYEEAQHHTVPNHMTSSPTQQMAPPFHQMADGQ